MEIYKNLSKVSGVKAYELGSDSITVEFGDGDVYRYTYQSAGRENVEQMKKLAVAGKGLNGFISREVKERYAVKLK
jgi:hypothetical protein